MLNKIHHIAIICSNYQKSKFFYTNILGLDIIQEQYRSDRQSYKLDLALRGNFIIELFSFPNPPSRMTQPEATGLRHLAFEVKNLALELERLTKHEVFMEKPRLDKYSNKHFTFIFDPDHLPIELYEQ